MKSPSVLLPGIKHMNGLNHNALTCSAVPIPPWERSLQTVEAQPYFNVSQASLVLEGAVFDRNNNLLFVDVATGRVFKLTPERQLSIVLKENSFGASGLAVHKDGRIFIASVGDMQRGSVRAIEPDGIREQMIVAPDTGFLVNDLVFDNQGGFYFTDSRGNSADPQGGVFYVSPNVGSIHAIPPFHPGTRVEATVQVRHSSYNRDKDGRLSTRYDPDSHTSFGVPLATAI